MIYSEKLHKALIIASQKHFGQKRKINKSPYIIHPFAVCLILTQFTKNEDILISAILHDTLEDTNYTKQELEKDFGKKILNIIIHLTEQEFSDKIKKTWLQRKIHYLELLNNAPYESLMVCAADKIHNLQSLIFHYKFLGQKIWNYFPNSTPKQQLWFHSQVFKILKRKLNNPIVDLYKNTIKQAKILFE